MSKEAKEIAPENKEPFRKIQEITIEKDPILSVSFSVLFTDLYTKICVGNREFYFNSETGKFDGTGVKI